MAPRTSDNTNAPRNVDPAEHLECRYCREFLTPEAPEKDADWNRVILGSGNFVVVPTLGHFIEGWVLVIPKMHFQCIGALDPNLLAECQQLIDRTKARLQQLYGPVIQFEHGPCDPHSALSCVDHAHMHLVPCSVDLRSYLEKQFASKEVDSLQALTVRYREKKAYLFYESADGSRIVCDLPVVPSQYMRQLLASALHKAGKYDWRIYRGEEELSKFLQKVNSNTGKRDNAFLNLAQKSR